MNTGAYISAKFEDKKGSYSRQNVYCGKLHVWKLERKIQNKVGNNVVQKLSKNSDPRKKMKKFLSKKEKSEKKPCTYLHLMFV